MEILRDFSLSQLTTIKIGGKAKYFVEPENLNELKEVIKFSKSYDIPVYILGNGSNTIFGNVNGIVVSLRKLRGMKVLEKNGNFLIETLCGEPLKEIIKFALKENLKGIYKLLGFPASVGGAVSMNAGAFGTDVSEYIKEVYFIDWEGNLNKLKKEEIKFSYRGSPFPKIGIVYKVIFELKKESFPVIEEYKKIRKIRTENQPINLPTSGSTFKNPEGNYAGKLLEECGLKGFKLKNVGFSEKHANFLINYGGGTFEEVKEIISIAKEKVKEEKGINLEEEVKLIESSSSDGWKVL